MQPLYQFADLGLLFVRIIICAIFFAHGTSKWKWWTSEPTPQTSTTMRNILRILSVCEPLGAVAMLFGFLTIPASLALSVVMLGAIYNKIFVWKNKFFGAGGWEFELLILVVLILFIFVGAGVNSLDFVLHIGY